MKFGKRKLSFNVGCVVGRTDGHNNTNKKQEANISMYLSTDTNSSFGLWPRELNIWKKFRRL